MNKLAIPSKALGIQYNYSDHPIDLTGMPKAFRLTGIEQTLHHDGSLVYTAALFHEMASLNVRWMAYREELQPCVGNLVTPHWNEFTTSENGSIIIAQLMQAARPDADENLFLTVPHDWVPERMLVDKAAILMESLPPACRHFFNAVFWDGARFKRFCMAPSSDAEANSLPHGCLRYAVEMGVRILSQNRSQNQANDSVGILGLFLQDAGMAEDERVHIEKTRKGFPWDSPLSRQLTVIEWIAKARVQWHVSLADEQHTALMRILIPENAPDVH